MKREGLISIRQLVLDLFQETQSNRGEMAANMKDQLESLVAQMHDGGILYSEALREFKKKFILNVLRANRGNQCKTARELGMHRNTLSRTIEELQLDVREAKVGVRRPARSVIVNSVQGAYSAGA
jgi:Fis family transcriptional regulator, factor for inversion stimulation protein